MSWLFAGLIGSLTAAGIYLILRAQTFPVVLGLTLLSYAVNLFLFGMGRLNTNAAPVLGANGAYTDPLPQALVLTAIVIAFAMTAFVIVLALFTRHTLGGDGVNGRDDDRGEPR
ncbi:Na+/H+ antiporter subunit C [Halothiobacillus sp. DCM-1]|uniref:Na+/H+ antiporter subunit C n=1 Tax=Halothiobacillus sp. DCM-1 TaxID=3112558 RepID=UPI0032445549